MVIMAMKKTFYIIMVSMVVAYSGQVYSFTVTDPGSYTYYVEQIAEAKKTYDSIQEGIETSQEILTETANMKNNLQGSYNSTMGSIDDAKNIKKRLKDKSSSVTQGYKNASKGNGSTGGTKFKSMDEYLNKVFKDPKYASKPNPAVANLRINTRQRAYKNTILISEAIMEGQSERLKNLDKLARKIDRTENVKEATDLTNRMLVEIIRLNIEMLAVQVSLAEAYGLSNFSGIEKGDDAKHLQAMNAKKKPVPTKLQKAMKKKVNDSGKSTREKW